MFGADTLAVLAPPAEAERFALLVHRHRLAKTVVSLALEGWPSSFEALAVDVLLVDIRSAECGAALDELGDESLREVDVVAVGPYAGPLTEPPRLTLVPGEVPDEGLRIYIESVLFRRVLRRLDLMVRREDERSVLLAQTRKGLSAFYHDVNNPLAILSGNAQLLLEIGRQMHLGEDLMNPMRDIEESCRRLHADLQRIVRLKEVIASSGLERAPASADTP